MSDIESNEWKNDNIKREPFLSPHLIEKPMIEDNRFEDFDDLRPRQDLSGYRWGLDSIFALIIFIVFLIIILQYWLKWN